jgi:hypothetical protein
MNIDFENPGSSEDDAVIFARIRTWVSGLFSVPCEVVVMVTELKCADPGCPDVETFIAVLWDDKAPLKFRIACPASQVTFEHVQAKARELAG